MNVNEVYRIHSKSTDMPLEDYYETVKHTNS